MSTHYLSVSKTMRKNLNATTSTQSKIQAKTGGKAVLRKQEALPHYIHTKNNPYNGLFNPLTVIQPYLFIHLFSYLPES